MSYTLMIFPTPLDARCELRPDATGERLVGVPTTHPTGRPGQGFTIPANVPNAQGAALTITAPQKVPLLQRGILFLNDGLAYPWTPGQTAAFAADDFHLATATVALPQLVLNGQYLAQATP